MADVKGAGASAPALTTRDRLTGLIAKLNGAGE
jgi:hypothetical protein